MSNEIKVQVQAEPLKGFCVRVFEKLNVSYLPIFDRSAGTEISRPRICLPGLASA